MKTRILLIAFLLFSAISFSQQLTMKSNGNIYDSNGQKLTNNEVKELLKAKPILLQEYQQARTNSAIGGFLLGFGIGMLGADLGTALLQDKVYPSTLTYVGIASTVAAIPFSIGNRKKIKKAVEGYNESFTGSTTTFNFEKATFVTDQNGIGMRITF